MVGRDFVVPERTLAASALGDGSGSIPVLEAVGVGRRGALEPLDLSIGQGEAVGLVGLLGSGRTETARLLFAADRMDSGVVRWLGQVVRFRNPRESIAAGVALSPEDRRTDGIVPNLSVLENIVLALQARRGVLRALSRSEARRLAARFVKALGIKAAGLDVAVSNLSGGNQQKVLLARWLATEPRLLILDEPTRGVDVAAKAELLSAIGELRERGVAVLLISSELDEVLMVCNRLIVLRDRRKVAELSGTERTELAVLAAIAQ
jgi:simple sugar transport system ATP-binding protein